jgi:potassium efflux system protein
MRLPGRALLACAVACAFASSAPAQQQQQRDRATLKPAADSTLLPGVATVADTSVRAFAPSQIPLEADRTISRAFELSAAGVGTAARDVLEGARLLMDSLEHEERVADLVEGHLLTRRGLSELNLTWNARSQQVREWRRTLQFGVSTIDTAQAELAQLGAPWSATVAAQDSTVSPDLRARTAQVIDELTRVHGVLAARTDSLLKVELALSNAGNAIFLELQGIAAAANDMRRDLLLIDSPPLWRSLMATGSLSADSRGGARTAVPELVWFVEGSAVRIAMHVGLTLLVILLLMVNRERIRAAADPSRSSAEHLAIMQRPVAAILLVSATGMLWLYPRAPLAVYDVALLFTAIPLLLLIPELMPADLHGTARSAVGLLVLQRLAMITTVGTPAFRLVQLAFSAAGAALLWSALRRDGPLRAAEPRWRKHLRRLAWLLLLAFGIAIVANIVGNVSLADVVNSGVALSLFLALLVYAVTLVADIATSAMIRAGAQESRYLAARGDRVERLVVSVIGFLSLCTWFVLSMQGFLVWEPIKQFLSDLLTASARIGEVSISVSMVVLFLLVLFIGTQLARLISGIVELDVLGRMDLRRGVPITVGSLLRYALIAIAFLISLAATGIDLGNLAILGGALGVGIGFGLQNLVNNFISGLLLAFERPVGVGDTVQVGTNTGEVKEIGMRASVIRTLEGAEVIVPNSELITQDVINWTRSGTRRRVEVLVGVAYGNDPAKVIGLLTDVALQHPDVRGHPQPFTLFLGFGDNALNFSVRAWTDSLDWPVVRSDIAVAISAALRDAGIEIPFPQRDLHLKSVDAEVLKDLRGEATEA